MDARERDARRLRTALGLFEVGVAMKRQSLRRADPDADEAEIRRRVGAWLRTRPDAEDGDGPGHPVPWPPVKRP